MNKEIDKTARYVRTIFENDTSGHDWWHIYRVWQLAKKIAEEEQADMFIVEMAALLHDLDDFKFSETHENLAKTKFWLDKLEIPEVTKEQIIKAISTVSFKGAGVETKPKTLEGKIVQDADRLDAIGAIGIARTFAFGGHRGNPIYNPTAKPTMHSDFNEYKKSDGTVINHFYEKLLLLKDRLNTESAKKIGESRHQYLMDFLDEFMLEWDGKK
ncbi:MAG: HD domain-containing protein [Patescibacteria group bacterium]